MSGNNVNGSSCPSCGGDLTCYGREVSSEGAASIVVRFSAICGCGKVFFQDLSGGSNLGSSWLTACPFCTAPEDQHSAPPEVVEGALPPTLHEGEGLRVCTKFRRSELVPAPSA